ncbi:MAG: ABC-2 transporter permease [Finegoldia sp.]|nr:ABC-2 transporter permease [Finegoldia sp.]
MKALLYKDITSAKSTYLLALLVGLAVCAYGVYSDFLIIIPLVIVFMSILMSTISFSIDEQAGSYKFIFTTPISRESFVMSKYVLTLVLAILAGLLSLAIFGFDKETLGLNLILAALVYAIPIAFISIEVPFFLKYGAEKGRILVVVVYFLLFAIPNYLGAKMPDIIGKIQSLSKSQPYLIALFIFILANLILFISSRVGCKIIKDKDY